MGKTYYISTVGDDKNNGSFEAPFRTIQKGANLSQAGDTIFVKEGVYRERVSPPRGGLEGLPIVYMGEPGKNVIIKGSDLWKPSFQKYAGNIFYAVPEESMFNDDCYVDNKNPFKVSVSSTPYGRDGKPEVERGYGGDPNLVFTIGQVFVDGMMYMQKGYLSELNLSARTWYYHPQNGAIYIHFEDENPAKHMMEISTRRRIFAPHKRQLGYIVVEGFIMEHCGNQYPANFWEAEHPECQQAGAIGTRSGHHWVIKNNVIRFANGVGIDFGNEGNSSTDLEKGSNGLAAGSKHHIIDSNYIIDNGGAGTAAFYPSCITFSNNVVERNNNLYFTGKKRWESAGVKMHGPDNSIISNNLIRNNFGKWGLWLDQGSGNDTRVHGNLIIGNEVGFDLEIGSSYIDKMVFDNNILINNQTAIGSRESGGVTAIHNLIVGSEQYGVHNTITKTRGGTWSSNNHHYFNNIFLDNKVHVDVCPPNYYRSTDRQFDYNIYDGNESEKKFGIYTVSSGSFNFTSWQNISKSYNAGKNADLNSLLTKSISYQFNSSKLELEVNIGFDMNARKTKPHSKQDFDYYGNPIPDGPTAVPGPFQNLKEGLNKMKLWNGLRPLAEYELP
ncbi:MAG: right-handed parallel beta-helix repeat-containing protein [Mangrovibacterium sp.]